MIEFTKSQKEALDAFRRFLKGSEQVFMLKGAAGTGKTTIAKEFIQILDSEKRASVLMAPTGRAAYILRNKTGREALTIHRSIYGLTQMKSGGQENGEDNDSALHLRFALKSNDDSFNSVYFVDEASMLSDAFSENDAFSFGSGCLMRDLFDYAGGRKIVLIGDYAQLPPVGMNFSPALDREYIEREYNCGVAEIFLREVVRQSAGSVMLSNASRIRESIENKTFIEFQLKDGNDSERVDFDLLAPYYRLSPDRPNVRSAVITYSNRQALDYNLSIRRHYYGDAAPRLKSGDLLMICRNNYAYAYELFNGNVVQVEACQPDAEVTTRRVRVKINKTRVETVDLRFRKASIRFRVGDSPVSINVTLLDNFLDDPNGTIGGLLARALIVDFNNRLPESIKNRLADIRRWQRSNQQLSNEQKEVCEAYTRLLIKDPYYNAVVCKYGYAVTCHKAQGGEWENVFVDMSRYGGTANEDYFRWAYTALTRASKKVWRFRSPDFNYISNLVVEEIKPASKIKASLYAGDDDFRDARFKRILKLAAESGLKVTEDRSNQYQHLLTFSDDYANEARYQLWYNAVGYSAKCILVSSSSEELTLTSRQIVEESYAPEFVPFSAPDRPFAGKLVAYMRSQLQEVGIELLNITQEPYQDVFHLKTDGVAQIGLNYTSKGNYTYMRMISSLGSLDGKLQALRQRFI